MKENFRKEKQISAKKKRKKKMISIIGSGPVGSYLASLLKDETVIFEEHKEAGKPIQCTGILTNEIHDLIKLDKKVIDNEIDYIRLNAGKEEYKFKLQNKELIVNRHKFDNFLLEKAKENNVKIKYNSEFADFKDNKVILKNGKSYDTNVLVGADGYKSLVAKKTGLWQNREFWKGIQIRAEIKNLDKNVYDVYFDSCPDFFGWVVPENEKIARIGLGSFDNAGYYFNNFIKRFEIKKIISSESGLIPIWKKIKLKKDNVYLVGDAGLQLKNISGGGIIPGMKAAKILANCLNNGKNYEKEIRGLNRELMFSDFIRKKLNKLNIERYEELLRLMKKVDLGKYNRDKPLNNLGMFMKPGLIKFGIKNFLF